MNSEIPKSNPEKSDEFIINPENGRLVSHGHEYLNTPHIRNLIRRANAIRDSLPSVPDGHTRLWRGNRPGEVGQNPSFTNSLEGIALPFLRSYQGKLSYIDVPTQNLAAYEEKGLVAKGAEFILPSELAKQAKVIEEQGQ